MHHMFRHHRECRSRHAWGGPPRGRGRGRIGRLLEHGDLRFVILALLEQQPRHGYELIKALEERTGGAYRPSAGVIYPTLALLEDEGFARPAGGDTGRKLYEITDQGREALDKNRTAVEAVFARMEEAASSSEASRPRIERAMANLSMALRHRLGGRAATPEEIDRIVAMIDDTAAAVEKT
ncbi:PadR family transcriptional regulator [Phenylobacterium sp.]|jgi:DNA-binding PadR family transcriptional regulator|uniref:PadR family transcriptional regulator n=1 Tax=Phenylobacterium sp. TaxID=1871053 RepID=UPI002F921519